jgi:outer membrane biosynthesis protein TonB
MRTNYRVVLLTALAISAFGLSACSSGFDPEKLDIFGLGEKKKLPGERKDVFPGGVPGVTQGIPPEYMRGNQPPPETAQAPVPAQAKAAAAGEEENAATTEPEEKPKPKPKKVAKPKPQPQPQPAQNTAQPSAWPQQQAQPAQQSGQSAWPTPAQANTASPWPPSPQAGTFQR